MENEDLYRKLVILLKEFKNRPFHLAKYLVDNNALTENFIKKMLDSDKLNSNEETPKKLFFDINQMNDYYSSLTDDIKKLTYTKSEEEIAEDFSKKIEELIKLEKYEEAAILRDYMFNNGIKRMK